MATGEGGVTRAVISQLITILIRLPHLKVFDEFVAAEAHEVPPVHAEYVVRHADHDALALQHVQVPYPQGQAERDLQTDRQTTIMKKMI